MADRRKYRSEEYKKKSGEKAEAVLEGIRKGDIALEEAVRGLEAEEEKLRQQGMPGEYFTGGGMSDLAVLPGSMANMVGQLLFDAAVASDPRLASLSILAPSLLKGYKNIKKVPTVSKSIQEGVDWTRNWNKHPLAKQKRMGWEEKDALFGKFRFNPNYDLDLQGHARFIDPSRTLREIKAQFRLSLIHI